jgi:hypothetical protein
MWVKCAERFSNVRSVFQMCGGERMTTQFSDLRKWLEREIQNEAQTAGDVYRSETMQLMAMSKVTAYTRVIRKMDEFESAKAEPSHK